MVFVSMIGFVWFMGESGLVWWIWELWFVNGKLLDLCIWILFGFEMLELKICECCSKVLCWGNVIIGLVM